VVDLVSRRRLKAVPLSVEHEPAPVLDMTERRNEIIDEERRQVRRTILKEFFSAYIVIPDDGLQKVTIYDIGEGGVAIDTPIEMGRFTDGEEVAVRVYLNNNTYFPFYLVVQNCRGIELDGVFRHGCKFLKSEGTEEPLKFFVKFIESVTGSLRTDSGDKLASRTR
jgi:hypothetical protein